jgi:predicted nucleic acid-binding protein
MDLKSKVISPIISSMNGPEAVFDTNVLVAGLRSKRGASNRLLELAAMRQVRIHISVPLVLEYEAVLRRQSKALGMSQREISDFVDFICQIGVKHEIHFLWRPALRIRMTIWSLRWPWPVEWML